jgi:hypothetical protein
MAGLWNKKFDHKNGETRICKGCGAEFHTPKPRYSCNKCVNAKQKKYETIRREKYPKKDNYPFDNKTHEAGRRFCSIRTKLSNAWKEYKKTGDRDVITNHYNNQLKEIEANGILNWIVDRRDKETAEAKQSKSRNNIQKDYPNHHDYYEY